jgi:peptidylprolyl isomerase
MRLLAALLFTTTALAQTATKPASPAAKPAAGPHPATHAAGPCAKLPEISPKVPALPAGLPCARPLYTISAVPAIKLDYVSPLEGPGLRETLGLESSSFSLSYIDVKVGTGPLAAPHKFFTINYSGYLTDGTKFDSSFNPGREPFSLAYGKHTVIPGWDTGFDGMRIGGKRRLFIPWQLAYGTRGNPPTIPAKADLIFDVELLSQGDQPPVPKAPPAPPTPPAAPATPPTPPPPATPPPAATPSAATPPATTPKP